MRKKKGSVRYSNFTKGLTFILALVSLCVALAGIFGCVAMGEFGVFNRTRETVMQDVFDEVGYSVARDMKNIYMTSGRETLEREYNKSAVRYIVESKDWKSSYYISGKQGMEWDNKYSFHVGQGNYFTVSLYISEGNLKSTSPNDIFVLAYNLVNWAMYYKYMVVVVSVCALCLMLLFVMYLLKVAGHKPMSDEIHKRFFVKWPLELYLALVTGLEMLGIGGIVNLLDYAYGRLNVMNYIYAALILVAMLAIFLGFLMNMAVRVKSKTFWKNTLVYMVLSRVFMWMGKGCRALYRLFSNLPLIWKTTAGFAGLSVIEFIILMFCFANWHSGREAILIWWLLEKAILFPVIAYIALSMRKLKEAGENLAEGNLSYQVETDKMFLDFKEHGETLNRIGEGIGHAVDDRLKSERFKTELITNVSHDIKTPLTSIINYSDLICKEETDNANIKEYSEVLYRQSSRLKKLIEDLVDASKASTGNVEVNLEPCEIGVMLEQVAGEFETKLMEKDIDLIVKIPEEPIEIMADGRHLWRVFDNLMNNIYKYAQTKTRVYLSVEKKGDNAVINFKNISAYPLDLSSEELMERFVRGDKSRNTDGNGLGLSIAQSLTELQGGNLELVVDGDLFKVLLTFPLRDI